MVPSDSYLDPDNLMEADLAIVQDTKQFYYWDSDNSQWVNVTSETGVT